MALEQRMTQQLAQKQQLVMTPMMQQAIKLLQLSTLELQDLLQQELTENVVLEEADGATAEETPEAESDPGSLASDQYELDEQVSNTDDTNDLTKGEISTSDEMLNYFEDTSEYNDYKAPSTYEMPAEEFDRDISGTETLKDELLRQLHIHAANEMEVAVGERIIDLISDDGYFTSNPEEVAEETGYTPDDVEDALCLIQTFDPPGVGARDLRECLLIQAKAQEPRDPLLIEAIDKHLDDLERRRFGVLARALGVSEQRAQDLADDLSQFEPFPGRSYGDAPTEYITPDVFIEKVDGEWQVRVNDEGAPPLRISKRYRNMLADRDNLSAEEYEFILDKFRSARWLIRNIEQRKQTLYKVTRYIADLQRDFLDHGLTQLKPLRYRDVADAVGIHEATVCRVVNNKYVQTPRGLFELKYFFSTGLGGTFGEDQSAKSVMERIRELIENEDPRKPLSDKKITDLLAQNDDGVQISRRTVAKYRDKMGILPAHQRKRV